MKAYQDLKYREFIARLIPTLDKERILGIRMPVLRSLSKTMDKSFLDALPHEYHEENILHVLMINRIKDVEECLNRTLEFLPYLDNWAVVDAFYPKAFSNNQEILTHYIPQWVSSKEEYIVRFGLNLLRIYYLKEGLQLVTTVKHTGYYVQMMQAWLVCDGLIHYHDETKPLLINQKLNPWVHNKSIQKAVESLRISQEIKEGLKTLKV